MSPWSASLRALRPGFLSRIDDDLNLMTLTTIVTAASVTDADWDHLHAPPDDGEGLGPGVWLAGKPTVLDSRWARFEDMRFIYRPTGDGPPEESTAY